MKILKNNTNIPEQISEQISILNQFNEFGLISEYLFLKQKDFLESIQGQYQTKGSLSPGQQQWFTAIKSDYTHESMALAKEWKDNYTDKHRLDAKRCALYYRKNPPYFGVLVSRVLDSGEDLSYRDFNKMCKNKHAKKVLSEYEKEPLFKVGEMVQFRKGSVVGNSEKHAIVLEVSCKPISRSCKGSKWYKVLTVGDSNPIYTMEKTLKKSRKAK